MPKKLSFGLSSYYLKATARFLKQNLSILFMLANFMGSSHHHGDLQSHADCQICVIQSNVADVDAPVDALYLTPLCARHEKIETKLKPKIQDKEQNSLHARAPPKFS